MAIAHVATGAIASGTTTISPAFGQATTSGNCLVARIAWVATAAVTTTATGWVQAASGVNGTTIKTAIWYKKNCGASETAPTFTVTSGTFLAADLQEWSGCDTSAPLDQTGTGTGTGSISAIASGTDSASGQAQIIALGTSSSQSATVTYTDSWVSSNVPTGAAHGTGATSTTKHLWASANISTSQNTAQNTVTVTSTKTQTDAYTIATFKVPAVAPTAPQSPAITNASATPFRFVTQSSGQLEVIWTAPATGTSPVYDVHQSTDGVSWTTVQTGTTNTYYQASGLTNGTTYYYYVTARNSAGSADSTVVSMAPTTFTRSNGFEGNTPGTDFRSSNVAPSGSDPWDLQYAGGTYASSPTAHGSVSLQSGNNTQIANWHLPAASTNIWIRLYFQFQGTTFTYAIAKLQDSAGVNQGELIVSSGALTIQDSINTTRATFATALSINTWYRVEAQYNHPGTTGPTVRLYTSMDSTTITETQTPSGPTNWGSNTASFAEFLTMGSSSGVGFTMIDDVAVSEVGWIGPYVAPPPTTTPTEGGSGLRIISKMR